MESKYKISIPKPCHEDWNQMTTDATGKFCNSCAKSVVDFTKMNATEIQNYFIENQGQNVCGRFKTQQLDSIIIQIPRAILFSPMQFHRMFLLALLIAMGTTLFSCQNKNGDKQKIECVEVVDSTENKTTLGIILPPKNIEYIPNDENITVGKIDMRKYDSLVKAGVKMPPLPPPPPPPPKKDQVKFHSPVKIGEVVIESDTLTSKSNDNPTKTQKK